MCASTARPFSRTSQLVPLLCRPYMRLLFALQLAYYISTTFTLALWEVPRSDYWVMQIHHCCTVVLIAGNYLSG
jgi:hypothetical protein